jgi:hypothetical protein
MSSAEPPGVDDAVPERGAEDEREQQEETNLLPCVGAIDHGVDPVTVNT